MIDTLVVSLDDAKTAHHALSTNCTMRRPNWSSSLRRWAASKATEGAQMSELSARCEELRGQLQEVQMALDEATAEIKTNQLSLETAANERTSLQTQLDDVTKLSTGVMLVKLPLSSSIAIIYIRIDTTAREIQALRSQTEAQVERVRQELEKCLQDEQALSATLHTELDDQAKQLDECFVGIRDLEQRLQAEIRTREQDANVHQEAIALVKADKTEVDALLAGARHQIESIKSELAMTNGTLETLRAEKESLLIEITTLGPKSRNSYQCIDTWKVKPKKGEAPSDNRLIPLLTSHDSERSISSLTASVQQLRDDLSRAEKAAQTSELNLSLQGVQHKREMAEMQRRIAALQSKPNLDSVVHELEERNNEMEELLRAKCAEIEENDDRVLE
ncbi:Cytospin-A [Salix suchowensis]|nr:Cytospin-A [Salix suchowensis]